MIPINSGIDACDDLLGSLNQQSIWALENSFKYKGTKDEVRFKEIHEHYEKQIAVELKRRLSALE